MSHIEAAKEQKKDNNNEIFFFIHSDIGYITMVKIMVDTRRKHIDGVTMGCAAYNDVLLN